VFQVWVIKNRQIVFLRYFMSYIDRQADKDSSYATAYREWVESLPNVERDSLNAMGLCEPDFSRQTKKNQKGIVTLLSTAATEPTPADVAEFADEPAAVSSSTSAVITTAADVLASFCARIRSHPNPLLALDAACFASGLMDIEGLSESALATRHGVTRAAFSKLVIQWVDLFALAPSRGMRSKKARRAYRKSRLLSLSQNHAIKTS